MKKISNSLFWRLSIFFLITLLFLGGIFIYVTYKASREYAQETSQNLHRSLAEWIVDHSNTISDGKPNEGEIKQLFERVMNVNPSVEVYVLDNQGEILTFFAPKGEVQMERIDLKPIETFLGDPKVFIKGEDPRNPGVEKIFSAAPIPGEDGNQGYMYVILASQEYNSTASILGESFKMKLATKSFFITFLFALIFGMIIIWYLTKNINHITQKVNQFKRGDLNARINMKKNKGELSLLAGNIDSMADTIVENITEIKSVENLRKELITNVSHDLRTPLTAIQGYAETLVMLEDTLKEEDRKKYTNYILASTDKVKKLVDDLFEISKLESQQIKTKIEEFALAEMVSDIIAKHDIIAKSKNIDLVYQAPVGKTCINADIALIDRVMQNLLDNAIKHSEPNSTVIIETKKIGNEMQIAVKDTGIGIPKDEIPYIFDRFKKAKGNKQKGSGLGLAIVKKILELHHAKIEVKSNEEQGTIFSFNLPLA